MIHFSKFAAITIAASTLAIAACSQERTPAETVNADTTAMGSADNSTTGNMAAAGAGATQMFQFAGADGAALGSVTVSEGPTGLTLNVNGTGMPAGIHGIHLHEKGLCEGPKFESAGSHWNPAGKKHGRDNPEGAHLGDLANIEVGADGTVTSTVQIADAMMTSGSNMLADADGTALVVHAKADDYKTDPSGDSGDRIACTVLAAPKS